VTEDEAIDKSNLIWKPFNFNSDSYKKLDKRIARFPNNPFLYNHFESLKGLTTKTGLIRSLK
jgi:hypothetical protein